MSHTMSVVTAAIQSFPLEGTINSIVGDIVNHTKDLFVRLLIETPDGAEIPIKGNVLCTPMLGDYITGNFKQETHPKFGTQIIATEHIDVGLPRQIECIKNVAEI